MSCNRENVTWESKDGKWNIGFFSFEYQGFEDEGYDHEWDVDYNYDSFWFVSTGHSTPEDAYRAYTRYEANPGGTTIYKYAGNSARIKEFEELAWKFKNPELARQKAIKKVDAQGRRLRKEFLAALTEDQNILYRRLRVTFRKDDPQYGPYFSSNLNNAVLKGDWYEVDGNKVYNKKTGRLHSAVFRVEALKQEPRYSGYRSFARW